LIPSRRAAFPRDLPFDFGELLRQSPGGFKAVSTADEEILIRAATFLNPERPPWARHEKIQIGTPVRYPAGHITATRFHGIF